MSISVFMFDEDRLVTGTSCIFLVKIRVVPAEQEKKKERLAHLRYPLLVFIKISSPFFFPPASLRYPLFKWVSNPRDASCIS